MSVAMMGTGYTVRADLAATAWLNAAIASGNEDSRRPLYRTIAVEFFKAGTQFVGCDGQMLFRTWVPYSDAEDMQLKQPAFNARPLDKVVVLDEDKFALGFMRTLASAVGDDAEDLEVAVEPVLDLSEPALGKEVQRYVLTLRALGQTLSLKLFEGEYPNWRALKFGVDTAELVDGMAIGTKMFRAVGKLIGINGVSCTFAGDSRAIHVTTYEEGGPQLHGLLMPMLRRQKPEKPAAKAEQTDVLED